MSKKRAFLSIVKKELKEGENKVVYVITFENKKYEYNRVTFYKMLKSKYRFVEFILDETAKSYLKELQFRKAFKKNYEYAKSLLQQGKQLPSKDFYGVDGVDRRGVK